MCVEGGEQTSALEIRDICQFCKRYLQKSLNNSSRLFEEPLIEKYVYLTECVVCVCVHTHIRTHAEETLRS